MEFAVEISQLSQKYEHDKWKNLNVYISYSEI